MEQHVQICFIDYYQQKGIQLRAKLKKCAPILGYKFPSDKLTELVVRNAKPSLKQKKWNRETPQYEMTVNNVRFENLNREQYDLLYKIKANEQ